MAVPMYAIVNSKGLYLMQVGTDHAFTDDREQATKYFAEENALLKIKKLPLFSGLRTILIKVKSK